MVDEKPLTVQRLTAFSRFPEGGNRAGVVLDATGWTDAEMQRIATDVGYSETAFVTGQTAGAIDVRYFCPAAEVPFCGHATIALAVAIAARQGPGEILLHTRSGPVPVSTALTEDGVLQATLTSVTPRVSESDEAFLEEALETLGWSSSDLHPDLPPRISFAGASHLILVAARAERLDELEYDYDRLKSLLDRAGWTTVHLAWPDRGPKEHTVRNAFPAWPIHEDAATGAAAAAYGAYLREMGAISPPDRVTLYQGEAMGRPSTILVDIPVGNGSIQVSGAAVPLPES